MKCNQSRSGFELESLCPFPARITITPRTVCYCYTSYEMTDQFLISGSNEQLQQQLQYTLLKPDCHSWWISKMQSRRDDTFEERYAIKFCFKLGKNARETYGMLQMECFRRKRPTLFKSGQWHFHQDNAPVHNSILVTDYLTKLGIKTVPQPPYRPDLAPYDFLVIA